MSFLSRIQDQARQVDANRYLDEIFRLHVEVTDNEPRLIFIRVIQMTGQKGYRLLRARAASRCVDDEGFDSSHIPEMANRPVSQIPEVRATLAFSISVVICDVGKICLQDDVIQVFIKTTIAQQTRTLLAIGQRPGLGNLALSSQLAEECIVGRDASKDIFDCCFPVFVRAGTQALHVPKADFHFLSSWDSSWSSRWKARLRRLPCGCR